MVDRFVKGPRRAVSKLNTMVDKVNALDRIAGDQFIHITKQGDSYKLGLDIARLLAYLPILRSSGGGSVIRKAYAAAAAGAGATISCYLDDDGVGDPVTVTCSIAGGSALNTAIPRLAEGDMIAVWDDDGTWRSTMTFQTSEDCVCST